MVDIGSGKGYLSCEVARCHSLPVLGLDYREGNTAGGRRRDERMGKKWEGLRRRRDKEVREGGW